MASTHRDMEQHMFTVLQRRQKVFPKILGVCAAASALLVALGLLYQWPLALALLPWGLIGPFAVSVVGARCPRCARLVHRTPAGAFRPLLRCARCGFRG